MKTRAKKFLGMFIAIASVLVIMFAATGCTKKVNKGSNTDKYLFGKEVVAYGSQADAISKLGNDIDMAVVDSIMARYYEKKDSSLKALENIVLGKETFAVGAKKGNKALIEKINEGLLAVAKNDALKKTIYEPYGIEKNYSLTKDAVNPITNATDESWNKIVQKKKLVVGVTLLEPASYQEGKEWIGYETALAQSIVTYLNTLYGTNIELEFKVISWKNKENEIATGSIDLIWNNFTVNEERKNIFELSLEYLTNEQMPLVKVKDASKYTTADALLKNKSITIGVESGSSAEELLIKKK